MLSWLKNLWNLFNLWRTLPKTADAPKASPATAAPTDWIEGVLTWNALPGEEVLTFGAKVAAVQNWITQKANDAEYVSDEALRIIWLHLQQEREALILLELDVPEHIKVA